VVFDFENQNLKKHKDKNIDLVNILIKNINIVKTFFKNGIDESKKQQVTKSKAVTFQDYPNKKMKNEDTIAIESEFVTSDNLQNAKSKPQVKSKAISYQTFPNKKMKNEDTTAIESEFVTSDNSLNADVVDRSNYNDDKSIIPKNNYKDLIAQVRFELNNMHHYIFQVDENDLKNKIYYRINFNFDTISEGDLQHLINYLMSLVGKYSTNPYDESITLMLKSIFEQFNIPFSIQMAFSNNNNNNNNISRFSIPNKLLEFIFIIYLKPEEMFKPVEEINWLKEILINKSIIELMKFRNTLDVVIKNTHSTDLLNAKFDIETLIEYIDKHGINVLGLTCPLIIGESINIMKIIYGVIITDETYFYRLPNIFQLSDNVDEKDKFLKEIMEEEKTAELNIFNLMDLTTSTKYLQFNSENRNNNNFSLKSSLCLTYKEYYLLKNKVDNFDMLINGTFDSIKYLILTKLNEKFRLFNYETIAAEDISPLILQRNKLFNYLMSKIVEIEGIFNSSKALIYKAQVFCDDLKINNSYDEKYKLIEIYIVHALYGYPHIEKFDQNHFQEEYLFGKTKRDKRYKVVALKALNNALVLNNSSQKDLADLYHKKVYNFGDHRYLYINIYKYGIFDQMAQIENVFLSLNYFEERYINFKGNIIQKSILKLNVYLEELNKWRKLCEELHKLNLKMHENLGDFHEENHIKLIEKCKDLNLQIYNNINIINDDINNDDDEIETKNDNNNINTVVVDTNKREEISIDEIRSFVNANNNNNSIIEFEKNTTYSFGNNKVLELHFIDLIHKSFLSLENNRNNLIHFIYFYVVNCHFSDNNFMKDTIDTLGWSGGLNILGLRLIDLIDKTYDAHLLSSLLPVELNEKIDIRSSSRGDILKVISKYNTTIDETQLKSEAHAFKNKNWYTVWFTLNRIHDSLCWYYISYLDEKEKLRIPEVDKFLNIIQKSFKVTDNKGYNCFEYNIQEMYLKGKINTVNANKKIKNEYFKKLFHRKNDVNNRMVLSTAIKIVQLKFLDIKVFRTQLEDYSKPYKSEFVSSYLKFVFR